MGDGFCLGTIAYHHAEVAVAQGKDDLAERHFRESVNLHSRMRIGPDLARANLGYGLFLIERRHDRRDEGEQLVRLAVQEFARMELPELKIASEEAQRPGVAVSTDDLLAQMTPT